LINETMATAFERISKGQPKDATRLPAYVTGICLNMTRLALRPGFRNKNGEDIDQMQIRDRSANAEEGLLARERAQEVNKVLRSLGGRDRGVLVDLFYHAKERDEVCARYGVDRESLRLILFRARKRFQNNWEADRSK
jgi:RNA polymerase sigma factor (sigma-70 family)